MSHQITPIELAGNMGHCTRIFTGLDTSGKKVLFGEWEEPLTQMLGDFLESLSVEINLATKQIHAVALEVQPHIKDAAFFSHAVENAYVEFSRGETVQPLATSDGVDWAEVDRVRKENNLSPRATSVNFTGREETIAECSMRIANEIIERRDREARRGLR